MNTSLDSKRTLLYGAIILLLVGVIGIFAYTQMLSDDTVPELTSVSAVGGLRADEAGKTFPTAVLQDPRYLLLDRQPLNEKRVPVAPPASSGKANLFGS